MTENDQKIVEYEAQLAQVNLAISHLQEGPEKADLISLKNDLLELLSLSKSYCEEQSNVPSSTNSLDEEYNKFKIELEELNSQNEQSNTELQPEESETSEFILNEKLNSLEGKKCSAPFFYKWTNNITYHNAFISRVPETDEANYSNDIKVQVMFLNPIYKEMLPCSHYLNGNCKFDDSECKYSHGELVSLNSLKEYREPVFSNIKTGSRVLAKRDDELWYGAQVLEVNDNNCYVKFELTSKELCVPLHNIFPLDSDSSLEGESSNSCDEKTSSDFDVSTELNEEEIIRGIFNNSCTSALGEWEKFTKGFGSKMMAKMGYIHGSGLGKDGSGRVEPVEAFVFPAGKSLDHCLSLKQKAGHHKNLLKTQKKLKHLQKKQEEKLKKAYENEKNKVDVFTFINTRLEMGGTRAEKSKPALDISKSLNSETTRNLNVKYMQLSEESRKLSKEIQLLTQSLSKHKPNSDMFNIIKRKLAIKTDEMSGLNSSQKKIEIEQVQRKDRRKLTIF